MHIPVGRTIALTLMRIVVGLLDVKSRTQSLGKPNELGPQVAFHRLLGRRSD